MPAPRHAFAGSDQAGTVALLPDRSLCIAGVSRRVWEFSVSGYPVLYRWLRARNGEGLTGSGGSALLRAVLDVVWRIEELLHLFDQADAVLVHALAGSLTRAELGLPTPGTLDGIEGDDDASA